MAVLVLRSYLLANFNLSSSEELNYNKSKSFITGNPTMFGVRKKKAINTPSSENNGVESIMHPSDNSKSSITSRRKGKLWFWLGSLFLVGVSGGVTYGWFFIQQDLIPLIETELGNYLNRPVKVGDVKGLSLTGVRFGASKIYSTPSDSAHISLEKVDVSFNPIKLITRSQLVLNVTAFDANIYLPQGVNGDWLITPFDEVEQKAKFGQFRINLERLNLKNSELVLVARDSNKQLNPPVKLLISQGKLDFLEQGNIIGFDIFARFDKGGITKLSGTRNNSTNEIKALIKAEEVNANELDNLIALPITLESGEVDGNLEIKLKPDAKFPSLQGVATLKQITTQIPGLPKPLTKTEGQLKFDDNIVNLEKIIANLDSLSGVAEGNFQLGGEFDIQVKTQDFELNEALDTFKIPSPDLSISARLKSEIEITGALNNPQVKLDIETIEKAQVDLLNFENIKANLSINKKEINLSQFEAIPSLGGKVTAQGKIDSKKQDLSAFTFAVQAENIPSQKVAKAYETNLPTTLGNMAVQMIIKGNLEDSQSLSVEGAASFPLGTGLVNVNNILYNHNQKKWQGQIQASRVSLSNLGFDLPENIPQALINANLSLAGDTDSFSLETLRANGSAIIATAGGKINAHNLNLQQGQWTANLQAQGLRLNHIITDIPAQVNGFLGGNFTLAGNIKTANLQEIQARGKAQLNLASGTIIANNFSLEQGRWKTDLNTDNLEVSRLVANIPSSFQGGLNAQLNLTGNLDSSFQDIEGRGKAQLNLEAGTIKARNIQIQKGKFTTILKPEKLELAQLSPHLSGYVDGEINLRGNLENLNTETVTAHGNLNFSQGLSIIDQPLTTSWVWNQGRLNIEKAQADNFQGRGFIDIDIAKIGQETNLLQAVNKWELDIKAEGLNLEKVFPEQISPQAELNLKYGGKLDFIGKLEGNPQNPIVQAELTLNHLHLANLYFEPILTGSLNLLPETGVNLQLNGKQDRIDFSLNSDYEPVALNLQLEQMQIEGSYHHNLLLTTVKNIPLPLLKDLATLTPVTLPYPISSQTIAGELSGDFAFNFNTGHISAEKLTIVNPRFAQIKGDRLEGGFKWSEGEFILTETQFKRNQSQYNLQGNLTFNNTGPHLYGKLSIIDGEIQDILETFQIFEIADLQGNVNSPSYGKAADLWRSKNHSSSPQTEDNLANQEVSEPPILFSVGLPKATITEQLNYYNQVTGWLNQLQQEKRGDSSLPELNELHGKFEGELTINASQQQGIESQFNLRGKDWQWGSLNLEQLNAQGQLKNGELNLENLRLQQGKSLLTFAGQINSTNQTGELQLVNISLEQIQDLLPLPSGVQLAGIVAGNINLLGTRDNPHLSGQLMFNQARINENPIPPSQGEFTYHNSRLSFQANSFLNKDNAPIKIEGSLPYQLPFAKVEPASEKLNLNIRVKNQGLALLDIFSQGELKWLSGQGEVNLDIVGNFDQKQGRPTHLRADGIVIIDKGIIASKRLPNLPLTDINGKILFNFDEIQVENFTGNLSGGQVTMAGILPLVNPNYGESPLTITTNNLVFDLKEIYRGNANANLEITGSLFQPVISGNVNLFDGQILLGEANSKNQPDQKDKNALAYPAIFNQLQLNLGENVWVSRPPILNFLANGNLTINGSLEQPEPAGKIKLKAGQINLFAAQFGLVGGEVNSAEFRPHRGLDPYLDLQLATMATETTRSTVRTNPHSSEIHDHTTFPHDSLRTIRIQAKVKGFASQLGNNLELSSQPPRSKTEIVNLLGGNLINAFEQGDPALGLANLAGTAVFGQVQGSISQALGLSDFRIYATPLINEKERISETQLGIAAEASVDIREDLSVSVQKILNTDHLPQFGLRYRINEHTVIKGSSNFSDDSRGMIEYERRF